MQGGWRGPTGAILNTGFDMLTLGFLFWAAGYRINVAVLVAGYGIPQLLGKFTVVLGGVGVVEAGMVGLYALLAHRRKAQSSLSWRIDSFILDTDVSRHSVSTVSRTVDWDIRRTNRCRGIGPAKPIPDVYRSSGDWLVERMEGYPTLIRTHNTVRHSLRERVVLYSILLRNPPRDRR